MSNAKIHNINDIIDYVTNADDSELSELSDDEDNAQQDEIQPGEESDLSEEESTDDEDDNPLSLVSDKKHTYRWRKGDAPMCNRTFTGTFNNIPEKLLSPLEYFSMFFPDTILETVVEQTNLYSVQKCLKSVDTNIDEIKTLIGMEILMGIIVLPSYRNYWSRSLRFPIIADAMPRNRYELLRRYIHFVDNDAEHDVNDKLFKIKPVLDAVRRECVKVEPEEFHSIDEQIIPSKTKFTKIRQYNSKKPKKWGFKNLVRAGASGFMYDFYLYSGKEGNKVTPKSTKKCTSCC